MAYFIPDAFKMNSVGISVLPYFGAAPFVSGFEMSMTQAFTDVRTFNLQPGSARALTSDYVISYQPQMTSGLPYQITVDTETVGINGCFPYSLEALGLSNNTIFPVYIVGNISGVGIPTGAPSVGAIVATSDAFLPPGYEVYQRVGLVFINTALDIIPWIQEGNLNDRYYNLGQPINITTTNNTNFVAYDLTAGNGAVPPIESLITASITLTNTTNGQSLRFSPYDSNQAQVFVRTPVGQIALSQQLLTGINASGNATVSIRCENASQVLNVGVIGFKDILRNSIF